MNVKLSASTIIERDSGILLVKEGADPKGRFNLPGGGIKDRETLEGAAVRETFEETGLKVNLRLLVGIYQNTRTEAHNNLVRFIYSADETEGEIQTSEHHPEIDFFTWKMIQKMHEKGQISSLSVLKAVKDYREGKGTGLAIVTEMPRVKKKLLLPNHVVENNPPSQE